MTTGAGRGRAVVIAGSLAGLVLAGVAAVPSSAASPGPAVRMWRVSPVGAAGPRRLALSVDLTTSGPQWLGLVARVQRVAGRPVLAPVTLAEAGSEPTVFDGGAALHPCGDRCRHMGGDQLTLDVVLTATRDDVLVAVRDADAQVHLTAPGWRVRAVAPTGLRTVVAEQGAATGATAGGASAERFTALSAPGGRHGSVAWLRLACNVGGRGDLTLTPAPRRPGDSAAAASCDQRHAGMTATSPGPVTWRASGETVGVGYGPTRLLVLDAPRS